MLTEVWIARPLRIFVLVATLVLAHTVGSVAQESLTDPMATLSTLELRGRQPEVPLCKALLTETWKRLERAALTCDLPISDLAFQPSALTWKPLDPRNNLGIIKRIFAWALINGNWIPDSRELDRQIRDDPEVEIDRIEEIWAKYRLNLPELIASNQFTLDQATLSSSSPPYSLTIYRTPYLTPDELYVRPIKKWFVGACGPLSQDEQYPWSLFYDVGIDDFPTFVKLNYSSAGTRDIAIEGRNIYTINFFHPVGLYVTKLRFGKDGALISNDDICSIEPVRK